MPYTLHCFEDSQNVPQLSPNGGRPFQRTLMLPGWMPWMPWDGGSGSNETIESSTNSGCILSGFSRLQSPLREVHTPRTDKSNHSQHRISTVAVEGQSSWSISLPYVDGSPQMTQKHIYVYTYHTQQQPAQDTIYESGRMPERMPGKMLACMSHRIYRMPDRMSEYVSLGECHLVNVTWWMSLGGDH